MNSESFAYWLKGYFEISGTKSLTENQVQVIIDHLDLVFKKVTPDRQNTFEEELGRLQKSDKPVDLIAKDVYCVPNRIIPRDYTKVNITC